MPNSGESGDSLAMSYNNDHSATSDKLNKLAQQYNTIDAWLYAFPTPSDFLQFFERKLHYLEHQYNKIVDLANEYKVVADEGSKNEDVVNYLSRRVSTLEKNLSDVQTCLYDERENYVKLVAENEMLKLESEDYRRKFQAVLLMSKTDERVVSLFMQNNPKAAELTDKMADIKDEIRKCQGPKKSKYELLNPVILKKQVEVLEHHIKELNTTHREKAYTLKEHLNLLLEEKTNQGEEYENRLKNCVDSMREAKDLVHNLVLENVQSGQKFLLAEQEWAKERDKLIKLVTRTNIDTSLEPSAIPHCFLSKRKVSDDSASVRRLTEKTSRLEVQLMEKGNLIDEYKIKFIRMEKQMFRLREIESEVRKVHKSDVRKLTERNKLIEKRSEELETRRRLDNAGFREDIRGVKQFLTAIERKFRLSQLKKRGSSSSAECKGTAVSAAPPVPKVVDAARTARAPGNFANGNNDEADSEKETLTWEMLNHLLSIAAERACQLERRVKVL